MTTEFDYKKAFSRNLGWLTEAEQEKIRRTHVGIIGMGGVGGQYAETMARLGVGRFTLCDPDTFGVENTNRQNECKTSNYGKNKAQVIAEVVKDINPTAEITIIPGGITAEHISSFCQSIDIYLDGLDFFETNMRILIFREMHKLGKPAMTFAPVGAGSAYLVFTKESMSFDDYFGMHLTNDTVERAVHFLTGLTPSFQHAAYLVERHRLDFANRKTPSLPLGVCACAAIAGAEFMKVVLGRGHVAVAPWSTHFDAYRARIVKKYIWWGYKNPMQKLKRSILRSQFKKAGIK